MNLNLNDRKLIKLGYHGVGSAKQFEFEFKGEEINNIGKSMCGVQNS